MFKEFWLTLSPWKKFKLIMILILSIYTVIFAFVNWNSQEINFLFFKPKIPITLLISICLVAGYLFASLFDYRKYKLKENEINELKKQLADLESKKLSE